MAGKEEERELGSAEKRTKIDVLLKDVASEEILSQEVQVLKEAVTHDSPFPHGVLPNLFRKDFLKQVVQEIKDNSVVNFKESDLFKVFQSIDFANLKKESDRERMPAVMQLRSVLYSSELRIFMEQLNGLEPGTLLEQVDCACNVHMKGGHLLCHDDVIGTRKISYILYLTDPDPAWSAEEGGALELYASSSEENNRRSPDAIPSKSLLPLFNHMAYFVVEPGHSFHAVQEVLGERPRLSLQGWYHAADAPENSQEATLQRLKTFQGKVASKEEDTEGGFEPVIYENDGDTAQKNLILSQVDRDVLSQYIQETYLNEDSMAEVRGRFEADSSVQLRNFLSATWVEKLKIETSAANESVAEPSSPEFYQLGVSSAWKIVGPSHKQRFLEYKESSTSDESDADSAGKTLHQIRAELLQSPAFCRYTMLLTSLGLPTAHRGRVRRFRRGRDYTVAHYGLLTETSVLDATLCFVAEGNVNADPSSGNAKAESVSPDVDKEDDEAYDTYEEMWQTGDVGGFECYIAAEDEDDTAAAEYNQEDDTELLSVSASNNTLSLVYRDPGTMRFIRYMSARAPSSRWDIAMEYEVPGDDVDDELEDNNGGNDVEENGDCGDLDGDVGDLDDDGELAGGEAEEGAEEDDTE